MRFFIRLSVIALVFIGYSVSASGQVIPAGSVWTNQRGSTLTIDKIDISTNQMSGTFVNEASGFDCKGKPYAVTGYVDSVMLGWSVDWRNADAVCNSITSWTGYFQAETLITDWNFVHFDGDEVIITPGKDTFTLTQPSD